MQRELVAATALAGVLVGPAAIQSAAAQAVETEPPPEATEPEPSGEVPADQIDDLHLDRNDQAVGVVIGVGGFPGIGSKPVAVPIEDTNAVVELADEELETAPELRSRADSEAEHGAGTEGGGARHNGLTGSVRLTVCDICESARRFEVTCLSPAGRGIPHTFRTSHQSVSPADNV